MSTAVNRIQSMIQIVLILITLIYGAIEDLYQKNMRFLSMRCIR